MNPWRNFSDYQFAFPEDKIMNLTRVINEQNDLTEYELEYINTKVKPKEVVIIIFMLLLWLFSMHRSYKLFPKYFIRFGKIT